MDISKLNKKPEKCIAGASIFSGRSDPIWDVDEEVVKKLGEIWDSLDNWTSEHPSAPPLGYRGCFLKCEHDREWFAYSGVITLKSAGKLESRLDPNRDFERLLLNSAPKGILPEEIL
jgi:hypothetical protein